MTCPFPDPRHLIKKLRNQILNVRRLLIIGNYAVQLDDLMELADCSRYKHKLGLWKTDIRVNDKQNVNAAIRLFDPKVQECLNDLNPEKYVGIVTYLKLGTLLHKLYFAKDVTVNERIKYAWTLVQFLRFWKIWISKSGYSAEKKFISDQTFKDIQIAGHSFILFSKLHFTHHKTQPFEPWVWGSNACEEVFAKARCYVRTKNNFCHSEFLDICKRLQKVSETERNPHLKTTAAGTETSSEKYVIDISDFDTVLKEEMMKGDFSACELAVAVGFHSDLIKEGIIEESTNGQMCLKDATALSLIDTAQNSPSELNSKDEIKTLSNDEV